MATIPGIQRPARLDEQAWIESAFRNVYDNLYYLRDLLAATSSAVAVPVPATTTKTRVVTQPSSNPIISPDAGSSTIVGTHAQRLTVYAPANEPVGTMFFETDTVLLYIVSNASGINQWVLIGGGSSSTTIVSNEVPSGSIDGTNQTFVLAAIPSGTSLQLFYKGVLQEPGVDYTLSSNVITMTLPPLSGGYIRASYVVAPGALNFSGAEIPTGAIDGTNATYTLAHTPLPASSLQFYIKGVLQEPGVDYTLSGSTVTVALPPLAGSYLRAYYQY